MNSTKAGILFWMLTVMTLGGLRADGALPSSNAPSNLAGSLLGPTTVSLSWNDRTTNETQFLVAYRIGTNGAFALFPGGVLAPNVTSFLATGLAVGSTYQFLIEVHFSDASTNGFADSPVFTISIPSNFSTQRTTVDSGGGRSVSATYTQRTSIGTYGGMATAAIPAITARQGYINQFFDVTGLALIASSTNVDEGTTQQLIATAQMDDGTKLAASSRASWTVTSGSITTISTNGIATAAIVYQPTPATVRAQFQGFQATLGLTVVDSNPDNFGLYSSDGLPDSWQVQYFGINNPNAAPDADPFGSGQNNLFKHVAGLDPTDPSSLFVMSVTNVFDDRIISFGPRFNDRTYTLEFRSSWVGGSFAPYTNSMLTNDAGLVRTMIDTNQTPVFRYRTPFYRVRISKP